MLFLARSLATPFPFENWDEVAAVFPVRSDFAGVLRLCPKFELIAPCNKLYIVPLAQSIADDERLNAGVPTAALCINAPAPVSWDYLLFRNACCCEKLISELELLLKSYLNFFL